MYYTVNGWEQLTGPRLELFLYSAYKLLEEIESLGIAVAVEPFDSLELEVKVVLVTEVCKRLCDPNEQLPIYAFHDATFAAVVFYIKYLVDDDLVTLAMLGHLYELAGVLVLVQAVFRESWLALEEEYGEPEPMLLELGVMSGLTGTWSKAFQTWWLDRADELPELYLADMDFAMTELADADPDRTAATKYFAGIHPDYFSEAPPDPSPQEVKAAATWLEQAVMSNKTLKALLG